MSGEGEIELSDEMLEAIRILKSDQQTLSYAQLVSSHRELIERMDRQEAEKSKEVVAKVEEEGDEGKGEEVKEIVGGPPPPPKVDPLVEPVVEGKKQWWENYPQG